MALDIAGADLGTEKIENAQQVSSRSGPNGGGGGGGAVNNNIYLLFLPV